MLLYEYEGKELLAKVGIKVPGSQLLASPDEKITVPFPVVLKAQVLSGKRAQVGGIVIVENPSEIVRHLTEMFAKTIHNEKVEKILVEERVDIAKELYVSISYDTDSRAPVLSISESGGIGIEDRDVTTAIIDILDRGAIKSDFVDSQVLNLIVELFFSSDCTLLEINPLVLTKEGSWVALDAKVKLDDDAKNRHKDWTFPQRLPAGRIPTQREIDAKKIDEGDYRGTAGSAYFDLDGDIAILSSGGGVSLTAMDALIAAGGKAANFTEYSGNPPKEKVVKLTKIVLSKPNIRGLWVVGTVAANFTDIYETLSGLIEGLREAQTELGKKFDFPIVIRRGGPRDIEAFEMLRGVKDFDLTLQGEEVSIAESAKVMTDLAGKYAAAHK
ncbi:MAG: ATP citrate lyase citrate-binding domain-containing protein [bacterium]|nr:ATP citrate lyase citrate-binding domain-containing protein [bacterium]